MKIGDKGTLDYLRVSRDYVCIAVQGEQYLLEFRLANGTKLLRAISPQYGSRAVSYGELPDVWHQFTPQPKKRRFNLGVSPAAQKRLSRAAEKRAALRR